MRLNIALVDRTGKGGVFHDHVRALEALVHIPQAKLNAVGQVRARGEVIVRQEAARTNIDIGKRRQTVVQQRRTRLHRLCGGEHRR